MANKTMKQRVSDTHTFIGLHVIAIALVVTFILGYWDGVDRDVFEILNSWLAMSMGWAEFVALANQRWIDLLSGGFMLASVGFYLYRGKYLWFVVPVIIALGSPRLLVGAHWLTDFICGSLPLALITAAWLFHSKPGKWVESTMARSTILSLEWMGVLKKSPNQMNSV
ncbi:MAG: hypothetical protein LRY63_11020 [Nitrincola sp.]|nr:hypothetical protein [Nitrincola sp.]